MKKSLVSLLIMLVLATCLAGGVGAVQNTRGKATISVQSAEWERGGTVEITLELNRNPGFVSMRVCLDFPEDVFTVEEAENLTLLPAEGAPEFVAGEGIVFRYRSEERTRDLLATGNLARVRLKIRDDAPYGDGSITMPFSERLFDVQNAKGMPVPFDGEPLSFTLACPHATRDTRVLVPPRFSEPGVGEDVCRECGDVKGRTILPTIVSDDEKLTATVPCGVFSDDKENSVKIEYVYGGKDASEAKVLFGDSVVRAWRIQFFEDGKRTAPNAEIHLVMTPEFEIPEHFSLYRLREEDAVKKAVTVQDGKLLMTYEDDLYILVKEESALPSLPDTLPLVTEAKEEVPPTTLSPEEEKKRRERFLVGGVALVMILFGAGAVFLLRRGKDRPL